MVLFTFGLAGLAELGVGNLNSAKLSFEIQLKLNKIMKSIGKSIQL